MWASFARCSQNIWWIIVSSLRESLIYLAKVGYWERYCMLTRRVTGRNFCSAPCIGDFSNKKPSQWFVVTEAGYLTVRAAGWHSKSGTSACRIAFEVGVYTIRKSVVFTRVIAPTFGVQCEPCGQGHQKAQKHKRSYSFRSDNYWSSQFHCSTIHIKCHLSHHLLRWYPFRLTWFESPHNASRAWFLVPILCSMGSLSSKNRSCYHGSP